MDISEFSKRANLIELSPLDRVERMVFFLSTDLDQREFILSGVIASLDKAHIPKPNYSRIIEQARKSRRFVSSGKKGTLKLKANTVAELESEYAFLASKSEEIISGEEILPKSIFNGTRSYIERLANQVNASFESNLFDCCAVVMRRLLEVCLILTYKHLGEEAKIKQAGVNYKMLDGIINDAKVNSILDLSRNTRKCLDDFKKVGNFAAHKIEYSTRRQDIEKIRLDYRAAIEELMHKSGLI